MIQSTAEAFHEWKIKNRRINRLCELISNLLPQNDLSLLDVGSGDGALANCIKKKNNLSKVHGVDILIRDDIKIPVDEFDGSYLPFENNSFDYILLSDVLHHTENIKSLLAECSRVSSGGIIIKDHLCENNLDYMILRFMDKVGNSRYDVNLPHNYKSSVEWGNVFDKTGLTVENWIPQLSLYPKPFHLLFDRKMHFLCLLTKH